MSDTRFIADLHLGHINMALKRGFSTVEEHDEYIIEQWNKVVKKRDITWILGDVTMEKSSSYYLLDRLNGMKKVVLGNHDKPSNVPELLKYVNAVSGMVKYKGVWLSHCPVHPMELEYNIKRNIHGHIHENLVMRDKYEWGYFTGQEIDPRYHCVSCEHVDYTPKTLEQLGIER
jgi:calcineurin-like phosphoesterase family protein